MLSKLAALPALTLRDPAGTNIKPYLLAKSIAGRTVYLAFSNRLAKPAEYLADDLADPEAASSVLSSASLVHHKASDAVFDQPEQVSKIYIL